MTNRAVKAPPVFVIGNRRSGTTMLRLMLSCHPNIGIPPEGGFIVLLGWKYEAASFWRKRVRRQFVRDFFSINTACDWNVTPEDLTFLLDIDNPTSFSDAVHSIYSDYLHRVYPGKTRWGDKTTWFSNHIRQLLKYFPDAQFVYLVRDGRDVAVSYRSVPHLPNDIGTIARNWSLDYYLVRSASRCTNPNQFYKIHYEDLVRDTEFELQGLCRFLREEYCPEMLEFWRENQERELEPARHMQWKRKTMNPVSTESVGRWTAELTASEIQRFEIVAGNVLIALNYDVKDKQQGFRAVLWQGYLALLIHVKRIFIFARRLKARMT